MSKMAARYSDNRKLQSAELQAHLFDNGEVHWTLIRSNKNLGQVTEDEAQKIIKDFKMTKIFDTIAEDKEFLELVGFIM